MATRVEIEDIETTKSEKLLAFVLAVFFLIGGLWTYQKIDDYVADAVGLGDVTTMARYPEFREREAAERRARAANAELRAARDDLELRREAYEVALQAGEPTAALRREYERAQAQHASAQQRANEAEREAAAARAAAAAVERQRVAELDEREDRRALLAFVFRLLFVSALLALGYWLLARFRRRNSRYLLVAFALLGSTTVLAFVLAGDYITDYVDPLDLGPLVLSLFGIAVTLGAFAALQRYLARRVPYRRVRKGECPFCGYPLTGTRHCEGCGREVLAACTTCGEGRRVGTLHCGVCGQP